MGFLPHVLSGGIIPYWHMGQVSSVGFLLEKRCRNGDEVLKTRRHFSSHLQRHALHLEDGSQPRVKERRSGRGRDGSLLARQRNVKQNISTEERVAAFSNLGWRLSAALTQGEA